MRFLSTAITACALAFGTAAYCQSFLEQPLGDTGRRGKEEFERSDLGKAAGSAGRQLDPRTQVRQIITVGKAIASGNQDEIKRSIGAMIINGPTCLNCNLVAKAVLPNVPMKYIEKATGQGFLVFLATGDPVLVAIDFVSNAVTENPVDRNGDEDDSSGPSAASEPWGAPQRPKLVFTSKADCIAKDNHGHVAIGWKSPPTFVTAQGADYYLSPGDMLQVSAPFCPGWHSPSAGGSSLTQVSVSYRSLQTFNGPPEMIKYVSYEKEWVGRKPSPWKTAASASERGTCVMRSKQKKKTDIAVSLSETCVLKSACFAGTWTPSSQNCW